MKSPILVTLTAWISRFAAAIAQLLSIRMVMGALGAEQYAVFALLVGTMGWFMLADIGLGFSLQNLVTERKAKGRDYEPIVIFCLLCIGVLCALLAGLTFFLSWNFGRWYLGQYQFLSQHQQALLVSSTACMYLGTCAGNVLLRIWYGEHRGHVANLLTTASIIISLVGLKVALMASGPLVLILSIIAFLLPMAILPLGAVCFRIFRSFRSVFMVQRSDVLLILKRASGFWGFAVMSVLVLNVDYIVISQFLPPVDVGVYTVLMKVMGFVVSLYLAMLLALWPVLTQLRAEQKSSEVPKLVAKYILAGLSAVACATTVFAIFRTEIVKLVSASNSINIGIPLILLAGLYCALRVWTDTYAIVVQSSSDLSVLWRWVPTQAVVSITLQWVLVPRFGLYGILWGLIGSYLLTVAWVLPRKVLQSCRSLTQELLC